MSNLTMITYGTQTDVKCLVQDRGEESSASTSSYLVAQPASPTAERTAMGGTALTDGGGKYRRYILSFYKRNFGLFLVFTAQTFGSVMNTAAKLLTADGSPNQFHALQIIFVRMIATAILGTLYMWYKDVPDFPFGPRSMLSLLLLRGSCGFVGLFGLYYSLSYLQISDATAISFLVPTWTAILCYVWLREPYQMREAFCGLTSLGGVLLIARPAFLFGDSASSTLPGGRDTNTTANVTLSVSVVEGLGLPVGTPSSPQRAMAVLCSVLGTFAAATAYSTIRVIGMRVHSLISVNYFAVISTIGSAVIILGHPDLDFIWPRGVLQWVLVAIIAVAGFLLQFLLTEGLQREKGGRATNMTYFQMVLALVVERIIWGTTPPLLSLVGSALIISAAIWLSLQNAKPNVQNKGTRSVDEEASLLRQERVLPLR
ncbi:DUF6-domain-containing protein [Poronia punctata]|nr:DUF6-domain-containing protein [Poronia punctata]